MILQHADAVTRKLNQGGGVQFFSEIGLLLIDEVRVIPFTK